MKRSVPCLTVLTGLALVLAWSQTSRVHSQEEPPSTHPAKPAVLKVETGKVIVETSLKGIIEAEQTSELSVNVKNWSGPFIVKAAVAHGTHVKKGDVVLELETDKIDQALADLRLERELADIALKQTQEDLPILEQTLPLNLAAADRDKKAAEEDFKRYTEIEREHQLKAAEFQLKSQHQWLDYSREELKQLQKMYRDKDLTEETEEIILKRQRHQIEQLEFAIESLKLQQDRETNLDRPRRDQALKENLEKQILAWKKVKSTLPLELTQKRLTLQKQVVERARTEERFQHLEEDRAAMLVRAPRDGILYHGQADRGQWNTAIVSNNLRPKGVIQPKDIVMTVVSFGRVLLRADAEEKDLHALKVGLVGKAIPVGFPSVKVAATISSVSLIPRAAGSFEVRMTLDVPENVKTIFPGMAANAKFITYRNETATLVATSALFHDEGSDVSYVYVAGEGVPVRTEVETGRVTGDKTEILKGLKPGTEVLATKP